MNNRLFSLPTWKAIIVLFLPIAVVRVGMVLLFAPAIPYFDEWDGVVVGMAKPLLHGRFDPVFLLASHNGHPLLWTKLTSLFFLWADNLHFDNVPVCIFGQIVYAAGSSVLAWSIASRLGLERGWFLIAAILVVVLPFNWENITMGWGNPYMFLSIFSVGLIVSCVYADVTLKAMLVTAALAGAAAFSMASGMVASLIGMAILLWRIRLREIDARRGVCVCLVLMAWAVLGFMAGRTSHVVGQDADWRMPQLVQMVLLVFCWLPMWAHLARYFRGDRSKLDLVILCVGLWGFVQISAMILARPYFRLWFPISRYMDVIPIGMFAVLASLCRLANSQHGMPFGLPIAIARRSLIAAIGAVIIVSPLAFYWQLRFAEFHRAQAQVIRDYLQSHDPHILTDAPISSLAYPSRERLQALLDDPDVDAILAKALERNR